MVDLSKYTKDNIGKLFDYSVLPKNTDEKDIRQGCRDAVKYNCAAFYASSPFWLSVMKEELNGSDVLPAAAINFPFGSSTPSVKAFETEEAIKLGARSVDTVMNIGALKDGKYDVIKEELTKYILEVAFLTDEEISIACELAAEIGIDYAKTASGQFDGPSMDQFLIMKKTLEKTDIKLKVAGVKFPRPQNAYCFIMAGAELIGTRAAPEIIDALDKMRAIGIVPEYAGAS